MSENTQDSSGNVLQEGDAVQLIKDLKVKGSSEILKRGLVVKNIRLTSNPDEVEGKIGKGITVLKTCFLKKR